MVFIKKNVFSYIIVIILKLLDANKRMYGYQIAQMVKELSEGKILIKEGSLIRLYISLRQTDL